MLCAGDPILMASGYNDLLALYFSGVMIILAAVLCRGEVVLDSDGNEVGLVSTGSTYRIQHYAEISVYGGLDMMPVNESSCQNYVRHNETNSLPAYFIPGPQAAGSNKALELGRRYKFSFTPLRPSPCKEPGVWTVGYVNGNSFETVLAGQDPGATAADSWFEVRSTGKRAIYKLAVCPCEACELDCPPVGSFQVNGSTVLGVGGDSFYIQFQRFKRVATKDAIPYLKLPVR